MNLKCAMAAVLCWVVMAAAPVEAQRRGASDPQPLENPGAWFSSSSYPVEARRAGEEGRVVARVSVDASGAVTGCAIESTSGSPRLDEGTCAIIRERGRYRPALDKKRRPVAGTTLLPVRWGLEGADRELSDFTIVVEIDIAPSGEVLARRRLKPEKGDDNLSECREALPAALVPFLTDDRPVTIEVRLSFRLGQTEAPEQLPAVDAKIVFLRLDRVLVDEAGLVVECVPIRTEGFTDQMPACPPDRTHVASRMGPDGKPTPTWVVTGTSIARLSAPPAMKP